MCCNWKRIMLVSTLLTSITQHSTGVAEEPPGDISTLNRARRGLPAEFTIRADVDRPIGMSGDGKRETTWSVRATVSSDTIAVVWEATQSPLPTYHAPGTAGWEPRDFDPDGNLVVSRRSAGSTICDSTVSEEYSESVGYRVAPDQTVFTAESIPVLSLHDRSNTNLEALNLLRRMLWALGRPLPEGLGSQVREESAPGGMSRLRAGAWWGSSREFAESDLSIDPRDGDLVRHARFGPVSDSSAPECSSEGVRRFGNVVLADQGKFTIPSVEELSVRLVSFSSEFDSALVDEARRLISRSKSRLVRVVDYRVDKDHPIARLAKPGELEVPDGNPEHSAP